MLPGITVRVGEMLETLGEVAGEEALARVRHEPDAGVTAIVSNWPARFDTAKARRLGFEGDRNLREIIDAFIQERS
jgi:nucleoside-diphosphate-sugar epimerase